MFDAAIKDELSFVAGERYQYSDVGYFLLGMIIEAASGQRYRDVLDERFFKPLGMSDTSVIDVSRVLKRRAANYTLRDGKLVNDWRVWDIELPSHYGVLSTVKDLVAWEAALAAGKVLKPATLTEIWTPVRLNAGWTYPYGFGWIVDERRGHRMISHKDHRHRALALPRRRAHGGRTHQPRARPCRLEPVNSWGLTFGVAGRYIKGLHVGPRRSRPIPIRRSRPGCARCYSTSRRTSPIRRCNRCSPRTSLPIGRAIVGERLATLKSFTFVTCDDVQARSLQRLGARVSRVCHYRAVNADETRYYSFWLTADNAVADFWSSTE